jgi:hypothetical protein
MKDKDFAALHARVFSDEPGVHESLSVAELALYLAERQARDAALIERQQILADLKRLGRDVDARGTEAETDPKVIRGFRRIAQALKRAR